MANSTEGMSVDLLQHISRWFLRQETLKAANKILVDFHHQLPLSSVWGEGLVSSSDGQRFGIEASSLLASFYPRYFGYYERAIAVYTHISDQYSVFGDRAISCVPREALYVLDGLLENEPSCVQGSIRPIPMGQRSSSLGYVFYSAFIHATAGRSQGSAALQTGPQHLLRCARAVVPWLCRCRSYPGTMGSTGAGRRFATSSLSHESSSRSGNPVNLMNPFPPWFEPVCWGLCAPQTPHRSPLSALVPPRHKRQNPR
jgi:Tn3 transposase DDE domain